MSKNTENHLTSQPATFNAFPNYLHYTSLFVCRISAIHLIFQDPKLTGETVALELQEVQPFNSVSGANLELLNQFNVYRNKQVS